MPGCSESTRVVGYLPCPRFRRDYMHYEGLTHVVCGWPELRQDADFDDMAGCIESCRWHANWHGKKVIVGCGGGAANQETWRSLIRETDPGFVAKQLVEFVKGFDSVVGVDLDLDDDVVKEPRFKDFVTRLHASKGDLQIWGTFRKSAVEKGNLAATLRLFDFVTLRAFDYLPQQPPWQIFDGPAEVGVAVQELKYYTGTLGLSSSKVNLGLPYHGWESSYNATLKPFSWSWSAIAAKFADDLQYDYADRVWFNGYTTMRKKVTLALQSGVGLAMFDIGQDVLGKTNSMTIFINKVKDEFRGNETHDRGDVQEHSIAALA